MKTNNILIAEDDKFLGETIKEHLINEGFKVDLSLNGEDTLKKIKKKQYKLVFLDLIMPKKNGFDVMKEIKEKNIKAPPIVVFSNLSQTENEQNVLEMGAKASLMKHNISLESLVSIIEKYSQ